MSKFFYSRATTRICAKKPFIVIECKILTTHKKSNQTSPPACQKHATFHGLVWARTFDPVNRQLWWKSSKFTGKMEKIKTKWTRVSLKMFLESKTRSSDKFAKRATCEFFSAWFLLFVGSGPKRSIPIEKLGSSSLVCSIFQREGKLHCSLTGRNLWSQVKKMLTSSDLRTGVRK